MLRIFCHYTKCFIDHNLTSNKFLVLGFKLIIFDMSVYLNKKVHSIKLIIHSKIHFFKNN